MWFGIAPECIANCKTSYSVSCVLTNCVSWKIQNSASPTNVVKCLGIKIYVWKKKPYVSVFILNIEDLKGCTWLFLYSPKVRDNTDFFSQPRKSEDDLEDLDEEKLLKSDDEGEGWVICCCCCLKSSSGTVINDKCILNSPLINLYDKLFFSQNAVGSKLHLG